MYSYAITTPLAALAATVYLAVPASADGDHPDYSEHGIFDGFPGVSDDYTPWLDIEQPDFSIYATGVLPWHYAYGLDIGGDDFGFTGESIGAVDGLGGAIDLRAGSLEVTNAETYGDYITNPADPTGEGYYCLICNEFQLALGGHDLTAILNVFSNALPQLEIYSDGQNVFGDALTNVAGLDDMWWFTPPDFPALDLPEIFSP